MDVLIIGADNPVGSALKSAFSQWGRHQVSELTATASRWRSERQAKKAARKGNPQAVIDLRLGWQIASGVEPEAIDLERSFWLAKACERSEMHYLLLSTDAVFSGNSGRSFREHDPADATVSPGLQMSAHEERVLQASPSALILRSGPLFASSGENMLTGIIADIAAQSRPTYDNQLTFSPVATLDLARVISAIVDQLSADAELSGIFHYCSGDRATAYDFAETVLAAANQYVDCGEFRPEASGEAGTAVNGKQVRVLDCTHLRDSFAIKQMPWRGFVSAEVEAVFDE